MSHVAWLIEARINDRDAVDELMDALSSLAQADEPGTVIYEWNVSDDGSTLINYERSPTQRRRSATWPVSDPLSSAS